MAVVLVATSPVAARWVPGSRYPAFWGVAYRTSGRVCQGLAPRVSSVIACWYGQTLGQPFVFAAWWTPDRQGETVLYAHGRVRTYDWPMPVIYRFTATYVCFSVQAGGMGAAINLRTPGLYPANEAVDDRYCASPPGYVSHAYVEGLHEAKRYAIR